MRCFDRASIQVLVTTALWRAVAVHGETLEISPAVALTQTTVVTVQSSLFSAITALWTEVDEGSTGQAGPAQSGVITQHDVICVVRGGQCSSAQLTLQANELAITGATLTFWATVSSALRVSSNISSVPYTITPSVEGNVLVALNPVSSISTTASIAIPAVTSGTASATGESTTTAAGTGGPTTPSSAPATTTTTIPVPTTSASAPSPDSTSHLGAGAIAGIAVGAAALLAIVAIIGFFCWRRRHRQVQEHLSEPMYGNDTSNSQIHAEKDANVVSICPRDSRHDPSQQTTLPGQSPSIHMAATHQPFSGMAIDSGRRSDAESSVSTAAASGAGAPVNSPDRPQQLPQHGTSDLGMSAEDRARWDEEEARLDQAIADAERRSRG